MMLGTHKPAVEPFVRHASRPSATLARAESVIVRATFSGSLSVLVSTTAVPMPENHAQEREQQSLVKDIVPDAFTADF